MNHMLPLCVHLSVNCSTMQLLVHETIVPLNFADRGLIPRSISYIFKSFTSRSEYVHTVHISYMEIYNSQAYDLLDPSREVNQMSDLPAVTILEDDEGRYHMRNLSLHPCAPLLRFAAGHMCQTIASDQHTQL
jgi:hypothetical protein